MPSKRINSHRNAYYSRYGFSKAPPLQRSLRFESLEDRRLLAIVTVDTPLDTVDFNDGVTSLREAIFATNLVGGADEIQFDFSHDGPETILLTQGELTITYSLTIEGPGANLLTIDAGGNGPTPGELFGFGSRIFFIDDRIAQQAWDVEFRGLTLTGGSHDSDGGAILAGFENGTGDSPSNLSLDDMVIEDNFATSGGAIYKARNLGNVLVSNTIIRNNIAFRGSAGGIFLSGGQRGLVTIVDSLFENNRSRFAGGGISASNRGEGEFTILSSTFVNNTAGGFGGGVRLTTSINSEPTKITILDTMFSGNQAREGGGIFAGGNVTISGSTITGNSAVGYEEAVNRRGGYDGGISTSQGETRMALPLL